MSPVELHRPTIAERVPRQSAGIVAAVGYWVAAASFVGVAGYGIVQVLQVIGIVVGPVSDILVFATSLLIAPPFLVAMLALDDLAPPERKFFSRGAVSFATLYAAFALLIYVAQLGSVMPAVLGGTAPAVLVVTPHSLFWTIDALAYMSMGVAALFAFPLFSRDGPDAPLRWALVAHAVVTPLIAIVYFYPVFSVGLLILGSPWLVTALCVTGLLVRHFRRLLSAR